MKNKIKNTRKVEFQEDYPKTGQGQKKVKVRFEKDSTHYMHHTIAEKIKASGAKVTVSKVDVEKEIDKAKAKEAK